MQETSSFWTEIKALEDQLANTPDSFCFARLSEVYLEMGLADDALYVARRGVSLHPRYLSGQRILARVCHLKGLKEEELSALLVVTEALPEDIQAQKLLGKLLSEVGNPDAAAQAFKTALDFAPDDVECRLELASLIQSSTVKPSYDPDSYDDIIEDLEELEELEALDDEGDSASEYQSVETPFIDCSGAVQHHDPLSTSTLAELYVSQGFIPRALDIYRSMLVENPGDPVASARIAELAALESTVQVAEGCAGLDDMAVNAGVFEDASDETCFLGDESCAPVEHFAEKPGSENQLFEASAINVPPAALEILTDDAVTTYDGWLENIRRIRSCR